MSATAKKNDIEMISVIMAAEDSKARFRDATALLNYGFGKCQLYKDENPEALSNIKIKGGVEESVPCEYNKTFSYLNTTGEDLSGITKKLKLKKDMDAPVKKGDIAGSLTYELDGKEIGKIDVVVTKDVEKAGFLDYLKKVVGYFRT